jgi:hypothetical protein
MGIKKLIYYFFGIVFTLAPMLLAASASEAEREPELEFYQRVDDFLQQSESQSGALVQETHQLLQPFSEDEEEFIEKIKELKAYLRLQYDFSQPQVLQRVLLLEQEINSHIEAWNRETRRRRGFIAWTAVVIGALLGIGGAIVVAIKSEDDNFSPKNHFKETSLNILVWAPITIGAGLSLGNVIAAKEVEARQVLLVQPSELIEAHSAEVVMYEIEACLKEFLAAEKESSRAQVREQLRDFHSQAPNLVEDRIRYMEEVLKHAPKTLELTPPREERQQWLHELQESFALQHPTRSFWGEISYFLGNHMYGFTLAGALLGMILFVSSQTVKGDWTWKMIALNLVIGLSVGSGMGQLIGELIKEKPEEILYHEQLF